MQRQITQIERENAKEYFMGKSKSFRDRIADIRSRIVPSFILTKDIAIFVYEENDEIKELEKCIESIADLVKIKLEKGEFL